MLLFEFTNKVIQYFLNKLNMDLRIEIIESVNQDCRFIILRDIETGNMVSYRIGWKHEYILSHMTKNQVLSRINFLIKLIINAFCKKFNAENPDRVYKYNHNTLPSEFRFYVKQV